MKIVLLAASSRAGSDFFHSLIDGHSQILQFPGILKIDKKFESVIKSKNLDKISKLFIEANPEFFDSRKNKIEKWDKLGPQKKSYFKVNKKRFENNFRKISKNKIKSKLDILKNLHSAYFLTRNKKIDNKKILLVHTHLYEWTKNFLALFNLKNIEIVYNIRHPLSSLSSSFRAWLNYDNGKHYFSKDLFFQINLIINGINQFMKIGKVSIIQLERLHLKNPEVMKNFCKKFKLKYEGCMRQSTKNQLKWWADNIGKKNLSGINKKFQVQINKNYFYKRDLYFFQNLSKNIIKFYKYEFYFLKKTFLFNFLPMKCELLVWKNTFKNMFYKGFKWKHIVSIPFFYLLRIILINRFTSNQLKNYPKSL